MKGDTKTLYGQEFSGFCLNYWYFEIMGSLGSVGSVGFVGFVGSVGSVGFVGSVDFVCSVL